MTEDEKRYLLALKRRRAALSARDDLLSFAKFMRPDPDDHENPDKSAYQTAKHHRVISAALEEVEKGKMKRLLVDLAPRHGKSELTSRLFPAWYMGRNPRNSVIFATYNNDLAADFGRDVRAIMQDPIYAQVFPNVSLKQGAIAVDRLETEDGGKLFFTGVGGAITGRGANLIVADDLLKGRAEADSPTLREKIWKWWNEVLKTRLLSHDGRIVLIGTRWHESDVQGRLTNKMDACYSPAEARKWRQISLPAIARENDVLKREPGEALWPERFPISYLEDIREADPRGFQALYQGSPTPESGAFFPIDKLRTYNKPTDRPPMDEMRFYLVSDHAVSVQQDRDKTCIIPVGVDSEENLWIMDDVVWGRMSSDVAVEKLIDFYAKYKPLYHWAERGHISKSIGPFLRKRMLERSTFATLSELVPTHDKMTRAQSIQARMHMGKIYIPTFIPWFAEAKHEMTVFPHGSHDDFCDALAYLGLGLSIVTAAAPPAKARKAEEAMTLGWIKKQTRAQERALAVKNGGW